MTIAGVYVSSEGIVLGADSTASIAADGGFHFYNFAQKLFEIGEGETLGLLVWGLGGLGDVSYRAMLAAFADDLRANPASSVSEVTQRWGDAVWQRYSTLAQTVRFNELTAKAPYGQPANANGVRTEEEDQEQKLLEAHLGVGFCIAGYVLPNRTPEAFSVTFQPGQPKPQPQQIAQNSIAWWGVPNFFSRLLFGLDPKVLDAIETSGQWNGTRAELDTIARTQTIVPHGILPIRDAVDYVHTCIHCTIKAIKFSGFAQVCGGPIELAVITSDRKFRWIRHKTWDAAILDGAL